MPEHTAPDQPPTHTTVDSSIVAALPLPGHVSVWAAGRWRRGWLIARAHEPAGWIGLVQYNNDHGTEVTEYITADRIARPDCWLTDDWPTAASPQPDRPQPSGSLDAVRPASSALQRSSAAIWPRQADQPGRTMAGTSSRSPQRWRRARFPH